MEDKEMQVKEFMEDVKDSTEQVVDFLNKEVDGAKDQHIASILAGTVLEKDGARINQKSCIRVEGTNLAIMITIIALIDQIRGNFHGGFDDMLKALHQLHEEQSHNETEHAPEVLN